MSIDLDHARSFVMGLDLPAPRFGRRRPVDTRSTSMRPATRRWSSARKWSLSCRASPRSNAATSSTRRCSRSFGPRRSCRSRGRWSRSASGTTILHRARQHRFRHAADEPAALQGKGDGFQAHEAVLEGRRDAAHRGAHRTRRADLDRAGAQEDGRGESVGDDLQPESARRTPRTSRCHGGPRPDATCSSRWPRSRSRRSRRSRRCCSSSFRKNEVRIENNAGKATINATVLAGLRAQIAQKLLAQSGDFVSGLEI